MSVDTGLQEPPLGDLDGDGANEIVFARTAPRAPRLSVDVPVTAAVATHYLVKSYAIWGGSAFISIPVPMIRKTRDPATAVLSLCTTTPLGACELLMWHTLAYSLFVPIAAEELLGRYMLHLESQRLVYGIGHPFKHRAIDTANAARETSRTLDRLVKRLRQQPNGDPEIESLVQSAMVHANLTERYATAGRSYGDLVNIIASITAKGSAGLLAKEEWHTRKEIDIIEELREAFSLAANKDQGAIRVEASFAPSCDGVVVRPWLERHGSRYAPSGLVYREVLLELASNAANHGYHHPDSNVVTATISMEATSENELTLVVRNHVVRDPETTDDVGPVWTAADYQPVPVDQATGASLAASILQQLRMGRLEQRFRRTTDHPDSEVVGEWAYRVVLQGLVRSARSDQGDPHA